MKTKTKTIKAGYRMSVTTWENDADSYKTETLEGLSKELCQLYVAICKVFKRSDDYEDRICNLYEPDEADMERFNTQVIKLGRKFESTVRASAHPAHNLPSDGPIEDDTLLEIVMEQLDNLGIQGSSEYFTRVVESWTIEHVPADIVLTDVTKEFK